MADETKAIVVSTTENRNVYQRLAQAMRAVDYVQKGVKTVNNQYRFAGHDAVVAAVRTPLLDAGIVTQFTVLDHLQDGNRTEVNVRLDLVNIDSPDDRISIICFGYGLDPQDKGPGKAISYACKYALLKGLMLETGDDPDNDAKTVYVPPVRAGKPVDDPRPTQEETPPAPREYEPTPEATKQGARKTGVHPEVAKLYKLACNKAGNHDVIKAALKEHGYKSLADLNMPSIRYILAEWLPTEVVDPDTGEVRHETPDDDDRDPGFDREPAQDAPQCDGGLPGVNTTPAYVPPPAAQPKPTGTPKQETLGQVLNEIAVLTDKLSISAPQWADMCAAQKCPDDSEKMTGAQARVMRAILKTMAVIEVAK